MFDPHDAHGGGVLVDPVDHTVVASAGDVVFGQLPHQLLTYAEGLLKEGAGDELGDSGGHRLGEALQREFRRRRKPQLEMAHALGLFFDVLRPNVGSRYPKPRVDVGFSTRDLVDGSWLREQVERLFESFEIVRTHEHGRGPASACDETIGCRDCKSDHECQAIRCLLAADPILTDA